MTIQQWRRGNGMQLTPHFHAREMECKDGICSIQMVDMEFMNLLEECRVELGHPITINSGYRCQMKQDMLRKQGYETAVGPSSHSSGMAADITCDPQHFIQLCFIVQKVFAHLSIGTATHWLHVDSRKNGPRRWKYTK